ncbi:hypothetical protein FKM82_020651 [Ascaphus truei]
MSSVEREWGDMSRPPTMPRATQLSSPLMFVTLLGVMRLQGTPCTILGHKATPWLIKQNILLNASFSFRRVTACSTDNALVLQKGICAL